MHLLPDPMVWLRRGVPLTLLIDLLADQGPASPEIFRAEDADLSWTVQRHAA